MTMPLLMTVSSDLSHSKVVELLEEADEDTICHIPPVKPKAGEVYVYEPSNDKYNGKSSPCNVIFYTVIYYIIIHNYTL